MRTSSAAAVALPAGLRIVVGADKVATLVIDRPGKANTIDTPMHSRLAGVFAELGEATDIAAIVLAGEGTVFCGGGDRDGWTELIEDRAWRRRKMAEARAIVLAMLSCPLPIVGAINGPAIGLGCTLALCCDLLVMADDAVLADPHVSIGLVAGDGGAALLPELVPLPVARLLLFGGGRLSASQAAALSLAAEVVPAAQVRPGAAALAARLASQPPAALRDTKRSLNLGVLARVRPVLEFSSAAEEGSFDTPEFQASIGYRPPSAGARGPGATPA